MRYSYKLTFLNKNVTVCLIQTNIVIFKNKRRQGIEDDRDST